MAYIYQADIWCRACGKAICNRLDRKGERPANVKNQRTYDSDSYPKYIGDGTDESDVPQHCAGGRACLEAETLSDGSKVGYFFRNGLTDAGDEYVLEAAAEAKAGQHGSGASVVLELWAPEYDYLEFNDGDK